MVYADSNLFVKANERRLETILLYVDDLIFSSDDKEEIRWIRKVKVATWLTIVRLTMTEIMIQKDQLLGMLLELDLE